MSVGSARDVSDCGLPIRPTGRVRSEEGGSVKTENKRMEVAEGIDAAEKDNAVMEAFEGLGEAYRNPPQAREA